MDDRRAFDALVDAADAPVFVVTTMAHGERAGCLVGFATQTSIEPARFLVCLSRENRTFVVAADATHLAVHLVPATARPVAELFGGSTGDEEDKFAQVAWSPGPHDVPLLDDCPTRFVGRVVERLDLGDHVGHLLEPEAGDAATGPSLSFRDVTDVEAGHPPD
jgi:flavin reductase (DIM6/NTAB) family NADH-FMN oxidoreductase RutF